jgi:hypothetical protein
MQLSIAVHGSAWRCGIDRNPSFSSDADVAAIDDIGATDARPCIGGGVIGTSSITSKAVDDLALTVGNDAIGVIKASGVIIDK